MLKVYYLFKIEHLFIYNFENFLFINSVLFVSLCSSVNSDPP